MASFALCARCKFVLSTEQFPQGSMKSGGVTNSVCLRYTEKLKGRLSPRKQLFDDNTSNTPQGTKKMMKQDKHIISYDESLLSPPSSLKRSALIARVVDLEMIVESIKQQTDAQEKRLAILERRGSPTKVFASHRPSRQFLSGKALRDSITSSGY